MKLRRLEPLVARIAQRLATLLARTWRFRVTNGAYLAELRRRGLPVIFTLWHNRIMPLLYFHRGEGIVLLVSRHRDGGHLTALAERWGYGAVRGSSQRGGDVGLLGVVRALSGGTDVAITPDGPRGPAGTVKPGVVAAAQHAGAAILPIAARPRRAWRLRSWDRFMIPKPFTRIDVVYGAPILIPPGKDAVRRAVEEVRQALDAVSGPA